MRVAHVINRYGWSGGAENQLSMNLAHFSDNRIEHVVVGLFEDDEPGSTTRGHEDTQVIYLSHETAQPSRASLFRLLHRELDRLSPDLIHCALADAALGSRLYAVRRRTPVLESLVNISHDPVRVVDNPNVSRWKLSAHRLQDRLTMKAVTHFHALSNGVAESWSHFGGVDPSRVTVIPRGIDTSVFTPQGEPTEGERLREELRLPAGAPLVLNVGRQEPQKGQRYLVDAWPTVLRQVPGAIALIVGREGHSTPYLRQRVAEMGLESSVRFVGVRENIPAILRTADCFVFPSLFEGMGVSLLEAMSVGAPCVVSDARPFDEMVVDGDSALMVPVRDPGQLADAVVRVLSSQSLAARLGESARRTALDRFRIEDTSRRIEELYARLGGL